MTILIVAFRNSANALGKRTFLWPTVHLCIFFPPHDSNNSHYFPAGKEGATSAWRSVSEGHYFLLRGWTVQITQLLSLCSESVPCPLPVDGWLFLFGVWLLTFCIAEAPAIWHQTVVETNQDTSYWWVWCLGFQPVLRVAHGFYLSQRL
jgi:hypothetical protein